jgi:hypothetical protein
MATAFGFAAAGLVCVWSRLFNANSSQKKPAQKSNDMMVAV